MKIVRSIPKLGGGGRLAVCLVSILLLFALFTLPLAAQGENLYFSVKQGTETYALTPISGTAGVRDFYDYNNDESHTGLEIAEHSILFLYEYGGEFYLVIIHDEPNNDTGGEVEFSFSGLPSSATIVIRDDPSPDTWDFAPPTATVHWNWMPEHDDGVVIGSLGQEFSITITPSFISGVNEWDLVTGSVTSPTYTPLPSLTQPITITATTNIPPVASFTFSPTTISVGQAVSFDGSASKDPDNLSAPNQGITKYDWDFGDGTTASGVSVSHAYSAAGSYLVSLTVTDNQGATDTVTRTVTVSEAVVTATRTISTPAVLPGSTFRVIVEITTSTDTEGLGLDENLPGGWEINPIDNAGAAFKRTETQWIFARTIRAGETIKIVYDVTVPEELMSGPLPVKECITGEIDSAQPAFHKKVQGDSCLKVDSCLPAIVAISHLHTQTEGIDLTLSNDVTADQLQQAISYWVEDEPVPATCGNLLDLETLKVLIAHYLKCIPIDEPLPEEPGNRAVTVTRQILTPFPFHQLYLEAYRGNIFTVVVTIEANRDLHGLGLDENLPQSWEVKSINSAGGVFKESQLQWVFPEKIPAGAIKTITYEVTVPEGRVYCLGGEECKANIFDLSGIADSANPQFELPVGGETEVVIAKCLSIPIAIAYLDVEKNTIDATLSSKITFEQIQAAIAFWLEDEAVPGTCGKMIDFETMKLLIAYWLTDTPVDLSLGTPPSDPDGNR
ncbi:MAG: PKD domain-containing protein [Candidatus Bipolaricaulia bacterium]